MPEGFISSALSSLARRFGFICSDMHLISATLLSPHGFKWLRLANSKNKVLKFASEEVLLSNTTAHLGHLIEEVNILYTGPDSEEPPAKVPKISDSLYGYEELNEQEEHSPIINWKLDLHSHIARTNSLSESLDASAYWMSQPKSDLRRIALMILAAPASSAPVERVFSQGGLFCSSKQTRMKYDLLSALVKAKYNFQNDP
jgi:hypothetical protein